MPFPYGKDNLAGIGKYLAKVRDKYYNKRRDAGHSVERGKSWKRSKSNGISTQRWPKRGLPSDQVPVNMQSRLVTDYLSTVPGIRKLSGKAKLSIQGKRYRTADPNRRSTLLR